MLSTAIFIWVGAERVMSGHLTVGGFVAFSSLTAMAYAGIRDARAFGTRSIATVLLNRLNDIFEHEPEQGRDRRDSRRCRRSRAGSSCAASASITADPRRRRS